VSEVSHLAWSALDFAQGTIRIDHSKGQVDRVVYLAPDVAKTLRQWQRLQSAPPCYVFPSRVTRKGGRPLRARQIQHCMTRYLKLAGITKAYSPHSLRHYAASFFMPSRGAWRNKKLFIFNKLCLQLTNIYAA